MVDMVLAVYSRVGSMLQAAGVDLEALRDSIAARYGLSIDPGALASLAEDGRVRQADIEVLEAVALTLQVRVDDLLDVRAAGSSGAPPDASVDVLLDPERDARLRELIQRRDWGDRPLSAAEAGELETLIAAAERALVERHTAAAAQHLGVSPDAARGRITAEAAHFWSDLLVDLERMAAEVDTARAQRRARTD